MGKRRTDENIKNIENLAPTSSNHIPTLEADMKTRSKHTPTTPTTSAEYPASALIQSFASEAQQTEERQQQELGCRSPLLNSPNQNLQLQTPSKEQTFAQIQDYQITNVVTTTPTSNLKILSDVAEDQQIYVEVSGTPTTSQAAQPITDCVTPTTNLKVLINAATASPEIRTVELTRSRLFAEDEASISVATLPADEDELTSSQELMSSQELSLSQKSNSGRASGPARKEKSLGLLCQKFMSEFDPNPPQTARIEVCLDELASHLGTERRRIYDIVNVLESVEIMSRRAKNRYLWHGRTFLDATLVKLKHFAESEKLGTQLELLKEMEMSRLLGKKNTDGANMISKHPRFEEYMELFGNSYKKDRSLGVMSQKFLMLFLVSKNKTISLDMAAKVLLGDPLAFEGKNANSLFKTKIRRLYDIANILASLDLICKVHVTEVRGKKPAFSYIGPDVDHLASLEEYQYLKSVEVSRPGRTTLEMKMDELKRKMAETETNAKLTGNFQPQIREVPPVQLQSHEIRGIMKKLEQEGGQQNITLARLAGADLATRSVQPASTSLLSPTSAASIATDSTQSVFIVKSTNQSSQLFETVVTQSPVSEALQAHTYYLDSQSNLVTSPSAINLAAKSTTSSPEQQYTAITLMPFNVEGNQLVYKTMTSIAPRKILPATALLSPSQSLLAVTQSPGAQATLVSSQGSSLVSPRVVHVQQSPNLGRGVKRNVEISPAAAGGGSQSLLVKALAATAPNAVVSPTQAQAQKKQKVIPPEPATFEVVSQSQSSTHSFILSEGSTQPVIQSPASTHQVIQLQGSTQTVIQSQATESTPASPVLFSPATTRAIQYTLVASSDGSYTLQPQESPVQEGQLILVPVEEGTDEEYVLTPSSNSMTFTVQSQPSITPQPQTIRKITLK